MAPAHTPALGTQEVQIGNLIFISSRKPEKIENQLKVIEDRRVCTVNTSDNLAKTNTEVYK